ncbi:MAG: 4-hydroxy-3-methylbut-2-en-1-yl diphosphate synthase [Flavobacteriales bacterium]|nr:4-hydroxy-3-methylbut-2-en-1-yl diphosphate synthase [Flavobacteriales bacterium]
MIKKYCNSMTKYSRWKTREVFIGNVGIGGHQPIRVQSMTTTDTMNTEATVSQCIKMIDAGCELIRITTPSKREAENLKNIKDSLLKKGYNQPLIADIHYTPNAAEIAAKIVEKVRINPGNYADKKRFQKIEYTDDEYNQEIERIKLKLMPLIEISKEHKTVIRIGTNHGSLSDRILSRYGDTPEGMVESAMEFVRIFRSENNHQLVLSMKSSNPKVMIAAYRLLVFQMNKEEMNYPLHLGVTEAGDGLDGRIKSAIGIGSLLEDGIGDTIRVSLTEPPENEIPVALNILDHIKNRNNLKKISTIKQTNFNPFSYIRRKSKVVNNIGGSKVPVVISDLSLKSKITYKSLFPLGYRYSIKLDKWTITDQGCDYIYLGDNDIDFEIPGTLGLIYNYKTWLKLKKGYPLMSAKDYKNAKNLSNHINFIYTTISALNRDVIEKINIDKSAILIIETFNSNAYFELRKIFIDLIEFDNQTPVVICRKYNADLSKDQLLISSSIEIGSLFCDGFGDGVFIKAQSNENAPFLNQISFGLLQATRTRFSKTEYISCPSCGRTLFDLQETTEKIRNATSHLKGIKIGIMGCIVNGPGEMADADYGYVGSGVGKITLYKGQNVVKKNIPTDDALLELIKLIKENGDWKSSSISL